ncbi:MAG: FAD-dependent oxidoreductase [Nanoarchaeales archaeon]|nr:FAD-dependent oxidoreductase [Nanoarchaeales archaeon]
MAIKTINGKFVKIENQTDKTKLFTIHLDEEFEFESGQFVNLMFEHDGVKHRKPYSIASSKENKDVIELTINLVEDGRSTPSLFKMNVGDECSIMGPLGLFKLQSDEDLKKEKVALIGTGTGIAPLRSILFELLSDKKDQREIVLLFGTRTPEELLFNKEFERLRDDNPQLKYIKVISRPTDEWFGRAGYVQEHLDCMDLLNSEIYICGRPEMVAGVTEKALLLGADGDCIHSEKYL